MTADAIPHSSRPRVALLAALLLVAASGAAATAQDSDAWSIQDFVQKRAVWPRLKGTTLKLEGRYRGMNDQRMSFDNCDLWFEFEPDVRPAASRDKTAQVNGRLETRKGKLVFVVSRMKEIPTDVDRLADQRVRLPDDDAAPWYELADWAARRGSFYDDDDMRAGAADLRRAAIQIEYRQMPLAEIESLYALAAKAKKLGLPPELGDEIEHDAVRRELRAALKGDGRQRDVALTHALNRLTGAEIPLSRDADAIALQHEYEQDPLKVYHEADADRRRMLNRILYASAAMDRIRLDAADDGRNGYEIARRIEQTLPEFADPEFPDADEAARCRAQEIEWQLERVPKLARDELQTLSERLEKNGSARSIEVRREWLAAQEPVFRERGTTGLLDLAREYVALLNDIDSAATIYVDLYQTPTGRQTAATELVKLGYRYDGSEWTRSADAVEDSTAAAIRLGIVRTGMTSEQVFAALGKPTSVVKFAARDLVSELWVYNDHGVAIELRRRGKGDSIAREISELNGAPGH